MPATAVVGQLLRVPRKRTGQTVVLKDAQSAQSNQTGDAAGCDYTTAARRSGTGTGKLPDLQPNAWIEGLEV